MDNYTTIPRPLISRPVILQEINGENIIEYPQLIDRRSIFIESFNRAEPWPSRLNEDEFPMLYRIVIYNLDYLDVAHELRRLIPSIKEIEINLTAVGRETLPVSGIHFPNIVMRGGYQHRRVEGLSVTYERTVDGEGSELPTIPSVYINLSIDNSEVDSLYIDGVVVDGGKLLLPRCTTFTRRTAHHENLDYSKVEYLDIHISELNKGRLKIDAPRLRHLRISSITNHGWNWHPRKTAGLTIVQPLDILDVTPNMCNLKLFVKSVDTLICDKLGDDNPTITINKSPRRIINYMHTTVSFPHERYNGFSLEWGTRVNDPSRQTNSSDFPEYLSIVGYQHLLADADQAKVYVVAHSAQPRLGWSPDQGLVTKYDPRQIIGVISRRQAEKITILADPISLFYKDIEGDLEIPLTDALDRGYHITRALFKWINYIDSYRPICIPIEKIPPMMAIAKLAVFDDRRQLENMIKLANSMGMDGFERSVRQFLDRSKVYDKK